MRKTCLSRPGPKGALKATGEALGGKVGCRRQEDKVEAKIHHPFEGINMKRSIALMVGAVVATAALSGPALSQGTPQTAAIMKVDPQTVATGYRTSKVVGSTVVNEANETVGTIDDLIVTPSEKVPFAVLSVGGFLRMGTKYVVVPYSSLQVRDKKMVLPGATKESLKGLPEFKYSN
jgi:PRC-barrel domain